MRRGVWYAVGAYALWGLLPVYWKALHVVPALQVICHRVIWSCILLAALILLRREGAAFRAAVSSRRVLAAYALAAALISVNWFTYIWAVNAGFVVETSLGYFINPLISVLLGVVFLRERLRPVQWAAVGLAASGVLYLAWAHGSPPWIALVLATTFAVYGLVKKQSRIGSVHGLALETGMLLLPALAVVLLSPPAPGGAFLHVSPATDLLLVGTGVATSVPLLMFASASRRIPLVWVGVLQYIQPTIQFVLGVLVFHEAMSPQRLVGFGAVWAALLVFALEGALVHRAAVFPATSE